MPKRDPFEVLGVEPGASATTIKAAWRRLARSHHPDVSGGDSAASRTATRRMAEINAAYEELSDATRRATLADAARHGRREGSRPATAGPDASAGADGAAGPGTRRGGPPRPRP